MNHLAKTVKIPDEDAHPTGGAGPSLRHNLGWLVSLEGPGFPAGAISTLSMDTLIGSAEECNIQVFNDPTVSRKHAAISRLQDGYFYLTELGATNRIRLNARMLNPRERCKLTDGDEIQIGYNLFTFKDLG